ncbi:MAG: GlmU family protein [Lutibacter sp.]
MNYILFDGTVRNALLPLTYTRPVADLRVGILTIREKWEFFLNTTTTTITEDYLEEKFPMVEMEENILINTSILPNVKLVNAVTHLQENQVLKKEDTIIAFFSKENQKDIDFNCFEVIEFSDIYMQIKNPYDLFVLNATAIENDFKLITSGRKSESIPSNVQVINRKNIFIEKGANVNFSVLNASNGPIYIGKNATIMEGSLIRGPFALNENATVKMGAKIYEGTTIGPHCKVGGEISNSILIGYSNKGHDGFLGNSVLGEWCNIGADSNNSNLKNNYTEVKLWNYEQERFLKTGLQFCGLIMGDHSKCGINTMFNTGTVVGVSANIFGCNFPRNFIPSFSWGGASGFTTYKLDKATETANLVMQRRHLVFDDKEHRIFNRIFEDSKKFRK